MVIGAGCRIKSAAIYALGPDALVVIGDGCYLNGPEIAARISVTIGARCEIGSALIYDTDFHSVQRSPRGAVRTAPVVIGDDVWLAARTAVLRGTTVGDRSVVGVGCVAMSDVPPDTLVRQGEQRQVALEPPVLPVPAR